MYKVNKEILQTPVEEGSILLLEPKTGMYFEMNETAVFVYQAIESGLSQNDIVVKMVECFDVERVVAASDIKLNIEHLLSENIITLK